MPNEFALIERVTTLPKGLEPPAKRLRGRPKDVSFSRRLVLHAFASKSEELLCALRRKWGFPVPRQFLNDPDFHKDDVGWQKPSLTPTEIRRRTGLAKGTVAKRLNELCSEGHVTKERLGKSVLYTLQSLDKANQPIILYGASKRAQAMRAARVGLGTYLIRYPRGRPKRLPNMTEELELTRRLKRLPLPALRFVGRSSGLSFQKIDREGDALVFAYRHNKVEDIKKAIPKASAHFEKLARQNRFKKRTK